MEANNMAAIREALVGLAQSVQDFMATKGSNFYPDMAVALEVALEALAAPPRQCDVGTPEEQSKRLCSNFLSVRQCGSFTRTALEWAQMPYEEGGDK